MPYISSVLRSVAAAGLLTALSAPACAQEFTQTFINPSFGGNPFYSDHLIAIAGLDRPEEPEDEDDTPSADELLASQIRAGLTSSLTSDILLAIQNAEPGDTGRFVIGDQIITFIRTAGETRVTFTNGRTGEVSELVIPVSPDATSAANRALAQRVVAPLATADASQAAAASAAGEMALRSRFSAPLSSLQRLAPAPLGSPSGASAAARPSGEGALLAPPPLQ